MGEALKMDINLNLSVENIIFIKEMEKQDGNDNDKTKNDLVEEKTTQSR
jgi:hypothetical protein